MAIDHKRLAFELDRAERNAEPVELLTARFPSLTWEDARAVATANDDIKRERGERQVGYKLGWTSAQMREALGIDRPNWGTLWADQVLDAGTLDGGRRIHPKVEPELVYRCGVDLRSPISAEDVHRADGRWALGLEVVDPRFPSFDFDWLDNTADNSSSGAVVVGEFRSLIVPPAQVSVTFSDGTDVRQGVGANALGDPAAAIAWLVEALSAEGAGLDAGAIVFTGGLTAPYDARPGDRFSLECQELGSISLTC